MPTTCENADQDIVDVKNDAKIEEHNESESDAESEDEISVPNSVESRKALQIIRRTLELAGGDEKMYEEFYTLQKSVEKLLRNTNTKQTAIGHFFVRKQNCN